MEALREVSAADLELAADEVALLTNKAGQLDAATGR